MSSTLERIKQRREYLMKAAVAYTNMALAVLYIVLIAWGMHFIYSTCREAVSTETGDVSGWNGAIVFFLFMASCCLVVIYFLARAIPKLHQEARQLRYVPPVTADALPAKEVLVRGSQEPPQELGKALLRGIDGRAGTGEQELLRGSQGQERE